MTLIGSLELFFLSIYAPLWPKNPNVSVWHQYKKPQFSWPMRKNKLTPPLFLHCGIKTLTKNTIWVALGKKKQKISDFDHGTAFRRSPPPGRNRIINVKIEHFSFCVCDQIENMHCPNTLIPFGVGPKIPF